MAFSNSNFATYDTRQNMLISSKAVLTFEILPKVYPKIGQVSMFDSEVSSKMQKSPRSVPGHRRVKTVQLDI